MASKSDIQWEFLQHVAQLIMWAKDNSFKLTGGDLKRDVEQQRKMVERGLSKTMNSDHLHSLAIDFNIFFDYDNDGDKDYLTQSVVELSLELGKFWKSLHQDNYWGGDWGWDPWHFGRKHR